MQYSIVSGFVPALAYTRYYDVALIRPWTNDPAGKAPLTHPVFRRGYGVVLYVVPHCNF